MIRNAIKKIRPDHRDRDFHKSYRFGAVSAPTLPADFSVDAGLWMPNQTIPQTFAPTGQDSFSVPALPDGCTDYTQTDLCMDEDLQILNPLLIENVTHANVNGGGDIRVSLGAAKQVFGRTGYYNIRSSGLIDMFDSIRIAMYSSLPEKRAVSVGTPWFPDWNGSNPYLQVSKFPISQASWHNHAFIGWKNYQGVTYLISKPWQGSSFGDGGYVYWSRELTNAIFAIKGTGAFTLTKVPPTQVLTVDLSVVATIVSFIRNLLHL